MVGMLSVNQVTGDETPALARITAAARAVLFNRPITQTLLQCTVYSAGSQRDRTHGPDCSGYFATVTMRAARNRRESSGQLLLVE